MSWQDRLSNIEFSIKTGDGKVYTPLWKNGEKAKDFNVSKYNFINLEGSLVDRKKPQGGVYPLVFWFQGEDNIEQTAAFEVSANDNRFWTIEHPFYGTIKGQPTNLKISDKLYNATEISVDFWESISGEFPNSEISTKDEVKEKATILNALASSFLVENATPEASDIGLIRDNNIISASKFNPDSNLYNDFNNLVTKATKNADKLLTDTKIAFNSSQDVLTYAVNFDDAVLYKIQSYIDAYAVVKESLDGLFSKYNFESQGASIIASMCDSAVNPLDDDYITRSDIETVNTALIDLYQDYLNTLDASQVSIYDVNNNWSANVQIQTALMDLVFFTSNQLFTLSFEARQERTFELTQDSNIIILTHRFLGLDADDKNIDIFRKINNIKNNELYKIRKGKIIKYFV